MSTKPEEWWPIELSWGNDEETEIPKNIRKQLNELPDFHPDLDEHDVKRRHCKIWIVVEDIGMSGSSIAKSLRSNSVKHWAVVCLFANRFFQYELENSSKKLAGGQIIPRMKSQYDTDGTSDKKAEEDDIPKEAEIGSIVTSPRKIWELVCNHEMNFKEYNAGMYNCQNWAMELLKGISEGQKEDSRACKDLVKAAKEAKFTTCRESPYKNTVRTVAWSSGFSKRLHTSLLGKK